MKNINEMTDQEVLRLTPEDLQRLIKFRMAEEGIKILPEPTEPTYISLPPKNDLAYKVGGFDFLIRDKETALQVAEFFASLSGKLFKESYNYTHYDHKHIEPIEKEFAVSPVEYYTKSLADRIAEDKTTNDKLKKSYEEQVKEYRENDESAKDIRAEIYNTYRSVVDKYENFELMKERYAEYLKLAEDNETIAMSFLKKAYSIDAECESFITGNDIVKIAEDVSNN
jgi:ribosome-binding protein aMBF1 (putative translation factor)